MWGKERSSSAPLAGRDVELELNDFMIEREPNRTGKNSRFILVVVLLGNFGF